MAFAVFLAVLDVVATVVLVVVVDVAGAVAADVIVVAVEVSVAVVVTVAVVVVVTAAVVVTGASVDTAGCATHPVSKAAASNVDRTDRDTVLIGDTPFCFILPSVYHGLLRPSIKSGLR